MIMAKNKTNKTNKATKNTEFGDDTSVDHEHDDKNQSLDFEEDMDSNTVVNEASEEIQSEQKLTLERIGALEEQVTDLNDKLLRALAETENVRRRSHREREDALKYGTKAFAEKMLTVADNLSRGLQSIDPEERKKQPSLESIAIGIEMVQRDLSNSLKEVGVVPIEAIGKKFDPMFHEAMFEIEDKNCEAGTIMQVLEVGYFLHERTLRAAKVGITKGGPKAKEIKDLKESRLDESEDKKAVSDQSAYEEKGREPGEQIDEEL